MKKLLSALTAPFGIIRVIAKYEPSYLWWSFPQIPIHSVLPLLYVYTPKLIIEKLTSGNSYTDILSVILIYSSALLILHAFNKFLSGKSGFAADNFSKKLRYEVGKITARLKLEDMEAISQKSSVEMANNAANLTGTLSVAQQMLSNLITVCGLAVIAARFDFVFFAAVAAVLCCKSLFTWFRYAYDQKMREPRNKNQLVGEYLSELSYFNHGAEKEIRVNNLQQWFLGKVRGYRHEMLLWQYHDFRMYAVFEMLMAILTAAESFVVLFLLSGKYIDGFISIADFTMYFSAVVTITTALASFTDCIGDYNKQLLNVKDYEKLTTLSEEDHCGVSDVPAYTEAQNSAVIVFDDVTFAYPGTDKNALEHINLKITNGEKLVIVGLNGAGKTTLVKLLCKFYRPISGTIKVNGMDIWDIPNSKYCNFIAAVFQDYNNFAFSLAENISLTPVGDRVRMNDILRELGLAELISALPDGLETCISKSFSDTGVELSGGEGQKLAIARAIYKNAPILILDEPTASLDAKAESEIYDDFFRMSKNKTTLFISHRLAASSVADTIAVFDNGKVVEYGNHTELLQKNGLYAEMYEKQSRPYVTNIL